MLICDGVVLEQGQFQLHADFAFAEEKVTAIIGPSGAGKSTLLSALAGFLAPVRGRILCGQTDLSPLAPGDRPISVLFQDHNLFPHLTIGQNVGLALRPQLHLPRTERDRVQTVLEQVGLGAFSDRKPGALSGGQQSRAALARVLIAQRPIVLLDEPFSALGPALKDEMLDLVQAKLAKAGHTVIMVTHAPEDARRIADQIVLVNEGTASAPAPTEDLFANPPSAFSAYLGEQYFQK